MIRLERDLDPGRRFSQNNLQLPDLEHKANSLSEIVLILTR